MPRIDLHSHTTCSDGSFSPTALVNLAHHQMLNILSITDHDTTEGYAEAYAAAKDLPLELIPGIELSSEFEGREMHILGYFIDLTDSEFQSRLERLRLTRHDRLQLILDRLHALNIDISLNEVQHMAGSGTIGRPHIAQVLIEKRYVMGMKEAFERYLGNRGSAFVRRMVPDAAEIITWITEAGGIPVLAHPYWEGLSAEGIKGTCQKLVDRGLQGLEVFYGSFTPKHISFNLQLARQFNLLMTGGSDFHGTFKPDIALGRGRGSLKVPSSVVDHLRVAAGG